MASTTNSNKIRRIVKRIQLSGTVALFVLAGLITVFSNINKADAAVGDYLTQRISSNSLWRSVASSADGKKLAAVVGGFASPGSVFTSTDAGANWTERTAAGSRQWETIASSTDGTQLAAAGNNSYIYTSSDSGATWTERTASGISNWKAIASSADGTKLAAVTSLTSGYIFTSADSGATWTQRTGAGAKRWSAITSSADGTKLAASVSNNYIYTSSDSGATWTQRTSTGTNWWTSIASSADGTKLVAVGWEEFYPLKGIFTSSDSGVTWTQQPGSGTHAWTWVTSSADGTKIAAVSTAEDYMYTSKDSGLTWIQQTSNSAYYWRFIASSADGNKLVLLDDSYIYTADLEQPTLAANIAGASYVPFISKDQNAPQTVSNTKLTFSGLSYPGGTISVTVHSDPITCQITADVNGNWSCTLPNNIPVGSHTVTVTVTDPIFNTTEVLGPYYIQVRAVGESVTVTPNAPNTGLQSIVYSLWLAPIGCLIAVLILAKLLRASKASR